MASVRFRYFPILDDEGKYVGVVSRRNMMNLRKKQIILVDHNEKSQAVDGIDQAEVLEIIDHHRIGSMETEGPVYFRNVPVGCTCTIIYQMYLENAAEIDPTTAGLMLSAILSDTLMFRSPHLYPPWTRRGRPGAGRDCRCGSGEVRRRPCLRRAATSPAQTAEEVFRGDYKIFTSGEVRFGVGQGQLHEPEKPSGQRKAGSLPIALEKQGLDFIFYMFTDVRSASTDLLMAGKGRPAPCGARLRRGGQGRHGGPAPGRQPEKADGPRPD